MNIHEAIRNRRSVRKYQDRPIADDVVERLKDALRLAPSACNRQPWRFVMVTDRSLRQAVALAAKNQMWMADAAMIVVACGDASQAYDSMGGDKSSLDIDVAIALDHLSLAAVSEGLGTCWVGAFDEAAVKDLLGIPEHFGVVAMMPVGIPAESALNYPVRPEQRKTADEVFDSERFTSCGDGQ